MSKEKVVLAYSGGLDTSVCIKWLQEEKGLDVICVLGNVGQELHGLEYKKQKALDLGVIDCHVLELKDEFADEYLTKAIAANSMYENKYPLLSALSRPLLASKLVDIAHQYDAKYVAHGCTGKGNDQVRFEASILTLDPDLEVITSTAFRCPRAQTTIPTPSTTTCGAARSNAVCSRTPGTSLRTTCGS